jgi:DNA-binding transcriptional LysR family regulator
MELRHLRYFVAVAKNLSFTRAAADLRVAQPALSRQIRQLEDELGVRLLDRDRRSVSLTDAGRVFVDEAEKILRQSDDAVRAAKASRTTAAGHMNLGYVWGLFHTIAPAALAGLRLRQPGATVNLFDMTAAEQRRALADGAIDAGFIGFAEDARGKGLSGRKIGESELMLVLPADHPAARRNNVELKSLEQELFIAISETTYPSAAHCLDEACADAGFRPRTLQAAERGYTVLGLVAARCGVALLPESLRAMPHAGVVFRHLVQRPKRDLYVAWNRGRASPLLDGLLAQFAGPADEQRH